MKLKEIITNKKENNMKSNFLLICTVLFFATTVLGCNMIKGAGKDIENAGGSIQKTVDHND